MLSFSTNRSKILGLSIFEYIFDIRLITLDSCDQGWLHMPGIAVWSVSGVIRGQGHNSSVNLA